MRVKLENQPFLMTVQIRLNNTYVKYDDYLKSYINISASNTVEDLMKRPFKKNQ